MLRRLLLALAEQQWLYRFIISSPVFRRMAFRFVAGDTLDAAIHAARRLNAAEIKTTLDMLGENVTTVEQAHECTEQTIRTVRAVAELSTHPDQNNVSLKLTSMGLDLGEEVCMANMERILEAARESGTFIRLDMEGSSYTQATLSFFERLFSRHKNVGVVIQSYLYRSETDIARLIGMQARVRLCKGAYAEGPLVAFPDKADTDANYKRIAERLLLQGNYPAFATHDEAMITHIQELARRHNIPPERYELQMLYGILRDLQQKLVAQGHNVRVYVPWGTQWYPYFMRRLAERPANLLFFVTSFFKS